MGGSRLARLTRSTGVAVLGASTLGTSLTGCYTLRPVGGATPPAGANVAFDLNDAGRSALGPTIGPEVARIAGRLGQQDGGDYLVAVTELTMLRGGTQVWRGEQVRVRPGYVSAVYERRFSPARTAALGAAVAGGIVLLATRALNGSSNPAEQGGTPRDTAHTIGGRLP